MGAAPFDNLVTLLRQAHADQNIVIKFADQERRQLGGRDPYINDTEQERTLFSDILEDIQQEQLQVHNQRFGELPPSVLALLHPLQDFQTYCRDKHVLALPSTQSQPVASSTSSRSSSTLQHDLSHIWSDL